MSVKYTQDHEWIQTEGDAPSVVGITVHAQDALGDVVFVDLPDPGKTLVAGQPFMVVESVKTASDVHAPLGGVVREVNPALRDAPGSLNDDPWSTWLVRIEPHAGEAAPLDAAAYRQLLTP